MTTTIYKYELSPTQISRIKMPKDATILTVQVQKCSVCIWAKVNTDNEPEERHFKIYPTGVDMPDYVDNYIGTFQLNEGNLVFHVFEVKIG